MTANLPTEIITDDDCLRWLWHRRFSPKDDIATCPTCQTTRQFRRTGKSWRCEVCGNPLDVTNDTVFARSSIPLTTWCSAVAMMRHGLGISISSFGRKLGVPYTTAYRMYQRLRQLPAAAVEWEIPSPPGVETSRAAVTPRTQDNDAGNDANESRVEHILRTAQRAFLELGVNKIRIADVAKESGVAPASIIYAFGTKEALLLAALEYMYEQSEADIRRRFDEEDMTATERMIVMALYAIGVDVALDEHRLELEFFAAAARDEELRRRCTDNALVWRNILIDTLNRGAETGEFTLSHSVEDCADLLIYNWQALNLRILLKYEWTPIERAVSLGMKTTAQLTAIPYDRLMELVRKEHETILARQVATTASENASTGNSGSADSKVRV